MIDDHADLTRVRQPDHAMSVLAVGRIVLGVSALTVPSVLGRLFRLESSPAVRYLTRIYGARALALGAGYLTEPVAEQRRWHRLGLLVDASDTVTALVHLRRRDRPRGGFLALGALTGGYAILGALRLARPADASP